MATATHTNSASRVGSAAKEQVLGIRDSQHLTTAEVDEKPWKYIGYKGYSELIASERDFFILRRFTSVSVRVALSLQDQVAVVEEKLEELDRKYSRRDHDDTNNGSFRDDQTDRVALLEKLREKLVQYNEFVLQQAALRDYPNTLKHAPQDIKSLRNWHYNHEHKAISAQEQKYLQHSRDLFSVIPKEKTPLRKLLEKSTSFHILWFWRDRKAPELPIYDKGLITYNSDQRIDRFISALVMTVGMSMLIAPMWILEYLTTDEEKLGTITAFIVAFVALISTVTVSRPFEILGATAAYSAVLIVFLQLGPKPTTGSS